MFEKLKSRFNSNSKPNGVSSVGDGNAVSLSAKSASEAPLQVHKNGALVSGETVPSEKELAPLKRFDTVFLIDDSASMDVWESEVRPALVGVVNEAVKWDDDGIDIFFFNCMRVGKNINNTNAVMSLFAKVRPRNGTPTATALKRITEPYMQRLEEAKASPATTTPKLKPLNIVCLTDGAPNRDDNPEELIVDLARRLDAIHAPLTQVGIQFVQVNDSATAREALQHLDDNLTHVHGVRDLVDTVVANKKEPISAASIVKILLGAVNRKIDARDVVDQ